MPERLTRTQIEVIEQQKELRKMVSGPETAADVHHPSWLAAPPELLEYPEEAAQGETISLKGRHLQGLSEASFSMIPARVVSAGKDGTEAVIEVPKTAAGLMRLWVSGDRGQAYGTDGIRVTMPDDDDDVAVDDDVAIDDDNDEEAAD